MTILSLIPEYEYKQKPTKKVENRLEEDNKTTKDKNLEKISLSINNIDYIDKLKKIENYQQLKILEEEVKTLSRDNYSSFISIFNKLLLNGKNLDKKQKLFIITNTIKYGKTPFIYLNKLLNLNNYNDIKDIAIVQLDMRYTKDKNTKKTGIELLQKTLMKLAAKEQNIKIAREALRALKTIYNFDRKKLSKIIENRKKDKNYDLLTDLLKEDSFPYGKIFARL